MVAHRIVLLLVVALTAAAGCTAGSDPDLDATPGSTGTADEPSGSGADDQGSTGADEVFAGPLTVVVPNSPGTVGTTGEQRIMTALLGDGPNSFLGGDDHPVVVTFQAATGDERFERDGTWLTTNAAALGLYVSYFDFPEPGLWEVIVSIPGGDELGATLIEVVDDPSIPNVGDPAPPSETATGFTPEEIGAISTDANPDPGLYDLSIAEAVGNGRPTVIAFATPAFCQTALCGPTLEFVRGATVGRDEIDVVHVEPFDLEFAPQGDLRPIEPMFEWGLVTEPWVFVVDSDGRVAATFEGIMGQAELEAAIDRVE
jgi:hypothetical protein